MRANKLLSLNCAKTPTCLSDGKKGAIINKPFPCFIIKKKFFQWLFPRTQTWNWACLVFISHCHRLSIPSSPPGSTGAECPSRSPESSASSSFMTLWQKYQTGLNRSTQSTPGGNQPMSREQLIQEYWRHTNQGYLDQVQGREFQENWEQYQ